jgi:hypothetical protein
MNYIVTFGIGMLIGTFIQWAVTGMYDKWDEKCHTPPPIPDGNSDTYDDGTYPKLPVTEKRR